MSTSILLVVEEPTVAEFLSANLRHAGFVTLPLASASELSSVLDRIAPDLIVADAQISETLLAILARRQRQAAPPVLLLGQPAQSLGFTAEQLLPMPLDARTLLARVNARLHTYRAVLDDELIVLDGLQLDPARHLVRHRGSIIQMGAKEFGLLHFLMQHPERVHRRDQLLAQVWRDEFDTGERTVDVAIRRLRATLEPHGLGERIQTVRGAGYRFVAEHPHAMSSPGPTHH